MKIRRVSLFFGSALLTACGPDAPSKGKPGAAAATSGGMVKSILAERSGNNLHLTLTAQVKNSGAGPLTLAPPAVQLWAGAKAMEPFIAPGLEPAVIPAGGEMEGATHWWVSAGDLSGGLTLEMGGQRVEVKSGSPFALDLLPERKAVSLSFPDWKIR